MLYHHQRTTGVWIMSGTWKFHISMINLINPKGLHRILYRVNQDNENFDDSDEVVYRYNRDAQSF